MGAFFRFWEMMEVADRQAKTNVRASHVLSLLAIALGTAAKQVVTRPTSLTSATQKFGVFLCLSSLHILGYPCVLHSRKMDRDATLWVKAGSRSQERLGTRWVCAWCGMLGSSELSGAGG